MDGTTKKLPPRRRRRGLLAGLLGAIAMLAMAIGAPGASAAPFQCDAFGYLFQSETITSPHLVEQVDLATGEYSEFGQTADRVNGVGYNPLDNYFYGSDFDTEEIVKVNNDLSLEPVPTPAGFSKSHIGTFDEAGHYWASNNAEIFEVDYAPGSPTYGQLIHTGTIGPLPAGITNGGADWAWIDGTLYMAGIDAARNVHLIQVDPATGIRTDLTPGGVIADNQPGATAFGAVYADSAGNLYASDNGSGEIFRISTKTLEAIKVANGPKASGNDGARCALAPIPTVTVTKTVEGRVRTADQFTVGLVNPKGEAVESATTSGTATTATTTDFPASQGKTYTITDAMAAGSPSPSTEYTESIVCKDAAGTAVPTGGSTGSWTLVIASPTNYTCNVTNKGQADVSLTKQASPSPQVPGSDESYSLTIKNSGPSTAVNAKVSDPLPAGLTFVSAGQGCSFASGTVTCLAGDLAAGASKTFTVTATVAGSATSCAASALANKATASSETADPDMGNNSASACPPVAPQTDLELTKVASAPKVPAGGQVVYTLVVHNKGPSDARRVTVDDPLPAELTLVAARPSQGKCAGTSCHLGWLPGGGSAQILITANVSPNAAGRQVTNCASLSGAQRGSSGSDRSCAVIDIPPAPRPPRPPQPPSPPQSPQPQSDLSIKKKVVRRHPGPLPLNERGHTRRSTAPRAAAAAVKRGRRKQMRITAGHRVTYKLVVRNNGPATAPGVEVTDTFNHRGRVVRVKTTAGTCTKSLPTRCSLGDLAGGAKVTITVVVEPLSIGRNQRNAASVTGEGTDGDPKNNLSRVDISVAPRLRIVKKADRNSVDAGGILHYRIRVTNLSKGITAKNVRTCDRMPSGLAYVTSKAKAKLVKGMPCWTRKALKGGRSVVYRVTAKALRSARGVERNVATVRANGSRGKVVRDRASVVVRGRQPKPTPVTG